MSKRSVFTTITPLPASLTRKTVIDFFHNHEAMIDLNPLVIERHRIKPPETASADEASCIWYSLTDKVSYLPGGKVSSNVSYTACFNDLPNGLQTHCRAPAGVDIRSIWSLRGSLPGEPKEPIELGITVPKEGLYIREDVDLSANFLLSSFVRKTLKKAHSILVDRLTSHAERKEMDDALAEQFPITNKNMPTGMKPLPAQPINPNQASHPAASPMDPRAMPNPMQPPFLGHPQQPYGYPPYHQDPNYLASHASMAGSDPRNSDSRLSVASSPTTDPRLSYQSTNSYSSYGSQAQPYGHLNPPGYHQGYGYGAPPGPYGAPPPVPGAYGGYDNYNKTWNPQHGWYQPQMQPVEIASSEYYMPADTSDEKKKVVEPEVKKDEKKDDGKKKSDNLAVDDKRFEAYPQPARANTFEMM
ncbi:hypothetical protein H072_6838 [Dactylellina haptotyla CBS 200.50]|uniref:DUF7053 domain-containing protein n=1 Tax=Dactylellina haptotyla (strain CBS 200.50) TaxID=1284197 RepID=S8BVP1_DACHA|nr:hypothetical protein H072_6838 [Dactylellina haptotyla CBS 200.50]